MTFPKHGPLWSCEGFVWLTQRSKDAKKTRTRLCHAWSGAPFIATPLVIPSGRRRAEGIMDVDLTVLSSRYSARDLGSWLLS